MTEQDNKFLNELFADVLNKKDFYFGNLAAHFNVSVDFLIDTFKDDALEIAKAEIETLKTSSNTILTFLNCFGTAVAIWLAADIEEKTNKRFEFYSSVAISEAGVDFSIKPANLNRKKRDDLLQLKKNSSISNYGKFSPKNLFALLDLSLGADDE